MNAILRYLCAVAVAAPMICLCGCEGGGDDDAAPTVDVTGSWRGTSTFAGEASSGTLTLAQDGSSVTGTDEDGVQYAGSVSGNTLHLTSSVSNGGDVVSIDVEGPVTGDTMALSGELNGSVQGTHINGPITFSLSR